MEDKLVFRPLIDSDYETICSWWKWWRWPILPKDFLPNNGTGGLMIEKNNIPIVSGFLLITNSSWALLEWIVSNPKYRDKDRQEAIELLINNIEKVCKQMNIKHMFSVAKNKHLLNTHRKLGWFVDKQPSYEIIKNI